MIEVLHFISGPIENNFYIVFDNSKNCIIIDAPFDSYIITDRIIKKHQLNPVYIFITHTHWDHIGGLAALKQHTGAKVCVHKDDALRLSQPTANLGGFAVNIEPVTADITLEGDELISCGDMNFSVLHTPGHSPGAVCYLENTNKVVFTGDTLFNMSIGRTDFVGSDYKTLINSIKTKLMVLPDDFKVLCGHNESTTIGFERINNPYLQ